MNPTIRKFGYPDTLLREFDHWVILLRPAQVTLGSLVLAAKSDADAFHKLSRDAFAEQADAIVAIERALSIFCAYERINYLMLMMVDADVHFHVIPRYEQPRDWQGLRFPDDGWPGPPQLSKALKLEHDELERLASELRSHFV